MKSLKTWWHSHMPKVWGTLVASLGAAIVSYPALAQSLSPQRYGIGLFVVGILGGALDFLKPKVPPVVPPPTSDAAR